MRLRGLRCSSEQDPARSVKTFSVVPVIEHRDPIGWMGTEPVGRATKINRLELHTGGWWPSTPLPSGVALVTLARRWKLSSDTMDGSGNVETPPHRTRYSLHPTYSMHSLYSLHSAYSMHPLHSIIRHLLDLRVPAHAGRHWHAIHLCCVNRMRRH